MASKFLKAHRHQGAAKKIPFKKVSYTLYIIAIVAITVL